MIHEQLMEWRGRGLSLRKLEAIDRVMVAVLIVFAAAMSFVLVPEQTVSDSYADWLYGDAVSEGNDPYQPLATLSEGRYQGDFVHPRPPGAAVPLAVVSLAGEQGVRHINNVLGAMGLIAVFWIAAGRWGLLFSVVPLVEIAAYQWANHIWLVGGILIVGLAIRHEIWGGFLVGLAIAVKLWPALVVIPLLRSDRRRGVAALTSCVAFTVIGAWLIPSTTPTAVKAMSETSRLFVYSQQNGSPISALARSGVPYEVAIGGVVIVALAWWVPQRRTVEASIVAGLVASPLIWPGYLLFIVPFVAKRIQRREILAMLVPVVWLVAGQLGFGTLPTVISAVLMVQSPRLRVVRTTRTSTFGTPAR